MSTFVDHNSPIDHQAILGPSAAAPQPVQPFASVGGNGPSIPPGRISGGGIPTHADPPKKAPDEHGGVMRGQLVREPIDSDDGGPDQRVANSVNYTNTIQSQINDAPVQPHETAATIAASRVSAPPPSPEGPTPSIGPAVPTIAPRSKQKP